MSTTLVIGPGRSGRSLALAHRRAGDDVLLLGPDRGDWAAWARDHDVRPVHGYGGIEETPDVILLAVPDGEIEAVAQACAEQLACNAKLFVHVSGMHDLDVLKPVALEGGFTAAMHPVLQFVEPEEDADALKNSLVTVTADPNAREGALEIAAKWGARPVRLKAGVDRRRYHLGLALASNHITALLAWAEELLLPVFGDETWNVVGAMAEHAMRAARGSGPAAALTGPVARGDVGTVQAHLKALSAAEKHRYAGLLDVVVNLAEKSHRIDRDKARELRAIAEEYR